MESRLDDEGVGIVLLCTFMEEFFPREKSSLPDVFPLWHYNGLCCSNAGSKVLGYASFPILFCLMEFIVG